MKALFMTLAAAVLFLTVAPAAALADHNLTITNNGAAPEDFFIDARHLHLSGG